MKMTVNLELLSHPKSKVNKGRPRGCMLIRAPRIPTALLPAVDWWLRICKIWIESFSNAFQRNSQILRMQFIHINYTQNTSAIFFVYKCWHLSQEHYQNIICQLVNQLSITINEVLVIHNQVSLTLWWDGRQQLAVLVLQLRPTGLRGSVVLRWNLSVIGVLRGF